MSRKCSDMSGASLEMSLIHWFDCTWHTLSAAVPLMLLSKDHFTVLHNFMVDGGGGGGC